MIIYFHKLVNNLKHSTAKKSKIVIAPIIIAIILNLLIWLVIFIKLRPIINSLPDDQAYIPLHYNIYTGVDSYGRWERTFILPIFGLSVIFINTLTSFILYNRKEILSYFLSMSSALIQALLLIATTFIILINI